MQLPALIARLGASLALVLVTMACSDPEKQKVAHFEKGNQYAAEGRDEFAVIEYARAVQLDPRYGEARLKLAETHERMNDLRAAAGEYIRAADALPDHRDVQIKATQMLLMGGRFEDAKTRATVLLEKNPEDLEAILLRASAMALLRDPAGAIAEVEEALSLRPGDSLALATLGNLQMQAGDAAQAEAAFRQAIAMAPDSVDAHLAFANFLFSTERQAEAEKMLSMALAIEPRHLLANRMLAVFYMATDRAREAESPLKIVAESSKTPDAQFQLADYYVSVDRRDEARQLLTELVKDPGSSAQAETRLATLARDAGATEEAHQRIDSVLARLPNYVPALVVKAQWLAAEDKLDEALARATAAVTADPDSATAHFTLGSIHQRRRAVDEAIKAYNEVLRLNPRALAAQVELSRLNLGPDVLVVLDDQQGRFGHESLTGRVTKKVVPLPVSLSTWMPPPCARTIARGYITEQEFAIYQQKLTAIGGPLQGLIKARRLKLSIKSAGATVIAVLTLGATVL